MLPKRSPRRALGNSQISDPSQSDCAMQGLHGVCAGVGPGVGPGVGANVSATTTASALCMLASEFSSCICVVSWRESFKILAIALASATFWDFTPMLYPATTTGADSERKDPLAR